LAYADKKVESGSTRATAKAEIAELAPRLDRIYAQSNKGVHAVVTKAEADRIVVRAYLVLADLLAL
jgi:hypothetical protein